MKKIIAATLTMLLVLLAAVCACATDAGAPAQEQIELRFSWWGSDSRHEATLEVLNLYTSQNPHVRISGEYGGNTGYQDRLMLQLTGNTAPDIIQIDNPWLAPIQSQFGSLVDLSTAGIDISGFDQGFLGSFGYVDGTLYALPTGINGMVMLLNKNILDAAGVDYSRPWTWEDFINEGKKVNAHNPNWYFNNQDQAELAVYVLKCHLKQITGQQIVNDDYSLGFTREQLVQTLTLIKSMFENNVNEPASESFLYPFRFFENPKWINNEIGMCFTHASTVIARKEGFADNAEVAVMPILAGAAESGQIIRPAQMLVINSNSRHVEEAAKFVDFFFNNEEAALILKDHRSVPPTRMAQQLLVNNNLVDPLVVKAVEIALEYAGSPENHLSGQIPLENIMADTIEQAVRSGRSLDDVAGDMITQFELALEDLKVVLEG